MIYQYTRANHDHSLRGTYSTVQELPPLVIQNIPFTSGCADFCFH